MYKQVKPKVTKPATLNNDRSYKIRKVEQMYSHKKE